MKKILNILTAIVMVCLFSSCCQAEKKAKYVFYFIGDGMGFTHVSAAEAYLAQERGVIGMDPLSFTKFPVLGEATTFSASNIITCSSAAGTALATGTKTNNHFLGVDPDTIPVKSIAYKIHDAGFSVGVSSTVPLNHATPGAFFGHSADRNDYYSIGVEAPATGFEFFGAGGVYDPCGKGKDQKSVYEMFDEAGYTLTYGYEDFVSKKDNAEKILLVASEGSESAVPYAFVRPEGAMTHEEIVKAGIAVLEKNPQGFFFMSEGGQIDWAAHSNDLASTIFEVIDFSTAIEVAYQFYLNHQDETLIVVTADHETGGLALGREGYTYDLTVIDKLSAPDAPHSVADYMSNKDVKTGVSEEAKIGWTTLSHCGGAVPVWAIGAHSLDFAGRQDNTDIPKKICAAMGVEF